MQRRFYAPLFGSLVLVHLIFSEPALSQPAAIDLDKGDLLGVPVAPGLNTVDEWTKLEYPQAKSANTSIIKSLNPDDFESGYGFDSLNQHASFTICDVCLRDPSYSGCDPLPKNCQYVASASDLLEDAAAPNASHEAAEPVGAEP